MARRKKGRLPNWLQLFIVWFVLSGLSTFGVLWLRATERLSDRIFQPLAPVLCGTGESIVTDYKPSKVARSSNDRRTPETSFTFRLADCVSSSGVRHSVVSRLFAALWLVMAAIWLALYLLLRLIPAGRKPPSSRAV